MVLLMVNQKVCGQFLGQVQAVQFSLAQDLYKDLHS